MTKSHRCGLILIVIVFVCAIFAGVYLINPPKTASAESSDRYAYANSSIEITADKNKILTVEEELKVGFIVKSSVITRAVSGKLHSYFNVNGTALRARSFLTRITDISAEVEGLPAEAYLEETNGLYHHISIRCPDGYFEVWNAEDQRYYDVKLRYTYDLSDDEDGKSTFFINAFTHYNSRWFYYGGDKNNVARLSVKINLPAEASEFCLLKGGAKVKGGDLAADGGTYTFSVPLDKPDGYKFRAMLPADTFTTSAEYIPQYWYFAGAVGVIILFGVALAFIYRARRPVAPIEYEPPIINPLHFSAFWHGYARRKDACTLLLQWAGLGCVTIKKDGKRDIILTKLKDLPEDRTAAEKKYFDALFDTTDVYRSKELRGRGKRYRRYRIRYAASALAEEAGTPVTRARGVEQAKVAVMFSSLCALMVSCCYFIYVANDLPFAFLMIAIAAFAGVIAFKVFPILMFVKNRKKNSMFYRLTAWAATFMFLPFAGLVFLVVQSHYMPVYDYIQIMLISVVWILICLYVMPNFIAKRSEEAQQTYGKMLGFKKFLTLAEVSEMELMLDKNPDYYLDVLPYCMIMGLSRKLDKKTEFIAAPDWADGFDAKTFASSMFSAVKRGLITRKKKERK